MTEKYQPIPHRLKNMAVGGHVAGAVDILDDNLNRNQQEINADTYRKSETYSKEQLNSMITTPEQEYKSVVATSSTATLADIAALIATKYPDDKEKADTIYRVGNWDGTQYNTGAYSEYTWDGTEYVFMSKKEPGIEDTPLPESQNLPKGGGVYQSISESSDKFFLKPATIATKREAKYWSDIDSSILKSVTINVISNDLNAETNYIFGLFIKYSDEEETLIARTSTPSDIPQSIDVVLDASKDVEYIRLSAYNPSGGTIKGELVRNTWQQYYIDMLASKDIVVTEINRNIQAANDAVGEIKIISRGEISSFYNSDGTIKTLFLRGVNYDNGTGANVCAVKGSLVPDGVFLSLVSTNLYSAYLNSGNIIQIKVNNTTTSFSLAEGLSIDLEKLLKEAETEKREYLEEYGYGKDTTHQLLPKDSRLDDNSVLPTQGKVGYWSIRYTEYDDSIEKNASGEGYSVYLGEKESDENNHGILINGNGVNNSIINLNDIRNKKVTIEFEAKLNSGSSSDSLGLAIGGNAVTTFTLTDSWKKYRGFLDVERRTNFSNTVTLMLYNPVGDSSIYFSVRNISAIAEDFDNDFSNAKYKIACLERGENTQFVLGLLGDSWTQHSWDKEQNSYMPAHTNYVQPLTRYLRNMYGDAGGGYYSFSTSHGGNAKMGCADPDDADDTRGGTITYRDQIDGVKGIDAADATFGEDSWIRVNVKRPHNQFVIHFFGEEGSGVFTYSIDGGEAVEVDSSEYEGHSTISVTVPLSTHVIDIHVTSGSVMLFGVDMQRNNPGVRVHKIGNKGAYSYSYVNVDVDCWKSIVGSLGMDSITVLLGVNDGDTSFDVGENLVSIIDNIKSVSSYIDTCIISPSNTKNQNFYAVGRDEKDAAKKTHSKFVDLIPLFDILNNIYVNGKFYDNYHPTLSGGRAIADYLVKELFPVPTRVCDFSKTNIMVPYEINIGAAIRVNGTYNDNVSYMQIWRYKILPDSYYLVDGFREGGQNSPLVNWFDADGNFISNEGANGSQENTKVWEKFTFKAPSNAAYLYLNVINAYTPKHNVSELTSVESWLSGKTVAVLGDSISTNGNSGEDANVAEMVISSEDVGASLSAYITATDVSSGLTINSHAFTSSEIGTEATFTPAAADVGKKVGVPMNYNPNTVKTWWEWMMDYFKCKVIPVCWSGSSITSHEKDKDDYKASWAWHPSQIRKCGIRTEGTMERTAPDMIIVYRGTNDMTHTSGSTNPFTPDVVLTDDYFKGVVTCPANDTVSGGYGFKEGYYKTISALRAAYPNAEIVLCTLSPFKRIYRSQFPTNNGVNSIPDYNNAIREIADYMGCRVIEFDKAGITFENMYPTYISDSDTVPTHPNNYGHLLLGKRAIENLKK